MSHSSTTALPPPIPIEKPMEQNGSRNKTVVERKRRVSRSSTLRTKTTSMSGMAQGVERCRDGVKMGREKEDVGDETGLGFLPFCATCEKQIVSTNSSQLFCSKACRIRDSRLGQVGGHLANIRAKARVWDLVQANKRSENEKRRQLKEEGEVRVKKEKDSVSKRNKKRKIHQDDGLMSASS
ncbi:hypothetical protein B0J14DRAFT_687843 [Halenospora varia]|nr:hypothetical protein B0J14DRAFT_687843 [Halenospora varia]